MTTHDAPLDLPWAKVRSVDVDQPDAPRCGECDGPAVLEFLAEYEVIEMLEEPGEVGRKGEQRRSFACLAHAGWSAFSAASLVANARSMAAIDEGLVSEA